MTDNRRRQSRKTQRGFSLIELMISITLGLLITAVIATVFLAGNRSYRQDDRFARMQENGRFALKVLIEDLSMAGFWGNAADPARITSALATDCSVPLDSTPIGILDSPDAASANGTYPCIDDAEVYEPASGVTRPDVLAIKRLEGRVEAASTDTGTDVYLRTTTTGLSFSPAVVQTSPSAFAADSDYWPYVARIYYVRKYSTSAEDERVPTLVRKELNGSSLAMPAAPLVEGIENFQVEFGIDTTNDGTADLYTPTPTAVELLRQAVTARVYVLIRALDTDPTYENTKDYTLGSATVPAQNDHYYRRVYASTVMLRNPANVAAASRLN